MSHALELARQLDDPEALFDAAYLLIGPSLSAPQYEEEQFHLVEDITKRDRE